ncbi:MAG TPA: ribosome silencing factor [Clostridiales bacterium]|nr:ribosome silencing factor [Clostridiales bacterium]
MYDSYKLAQEIADILDDRKAENIIVLDISRLSILADYFVIASGRSELQVSALHDELNKRLSAKGINPLHLDQSKRWVVLDYGDIIVHIFHHEERSFYNLERLWADAMQIRSSAE